MIDEDDDDNVYNEKSKKCLRFEIDCQEITKNISIFIELKFPDVFVFILQKIQC